MFKRPTTALLLLCGWLGAATPALARPLGVAPLLAQRSYVFPVLGTVVLFAVVFFVVCKSARRAQ